MGKAWYWDRKTFKRNERMLDAVRALDAELAWRSEHSESHTPETTYSFPRTDFGRVTWDTSYKRFHPLCWQYVSSDRWLNRHVPDGHLVPASNLDIPAFDESRLPLHIIDQFDIASIDEIDEGFEIFGGLDHSTSVYFLEAAFSGLIKIGIASHLDSRVSSIQSAAQEPISLIGHIPGNRDLEKFLHGVFEPMKHHGEWFYPHWTIYSVIMGLEG